MKTTIFLILMILSTIASADSVSANLETFYFDRSFDKADTENATALTVGGIVRYQKDLGDTALTLGSYSSFSSGIFSDKRGSGTSLLTKDGSNIFFIGEANVGFTVGDTTIKVGRQQLATPLANGHDLRLLPSSYEAATVTNSSLPSTTVEAAYISKYSGFTSKGNGFDRPDAWGKGLVSVSGKTDIDNLTFRGQVIHAIDAPSISNYYYADGKVVSDNAYFKVQIGGNTYKSESDSLLLGAKVGTKIAGVDLALLTDKISGNAFKSVEAGPMYSDWQQGYGNYEESTAYGAQIVVHPTTNSSVKLGYVDVAADASNKRDDFSEFNIDAKVKLSKDVKARVRFSRKDQTSQSDREDRDDFRVILYYSF